LGTCETGIPQPTARRGMLPDLIARIRNGETVAKVLDVAKRRLLLGKFDCGERLSESSWAFLELLANLRPRDFTKAAGKDGILATNHRIAHHISACNARRELQRQLPAGVSAKVLIQTLKGRGYRLHPSVRIRGRGEVGLQFRDEGRLATSYPQEEEGEDGNTSEET